MGKGLLSWQRSSLPVSLCSTGGIGGRCRGGGPLGATGKLAALEGRCSGRHLCQADISVRLTTQGASDLPLTLAARASPAQEGCSESLVAPPWAGCLWTLSLHCVLHGRVIAEGEVFATNPSWHPGPAHSAGLSLSHPRPSLPFLSCCSDHLPERHVEHPGGSGFGNSSSWWNWKCIR